MVIGITGFILFSTFSNKEETVGIGYSVYQNGSGWGYDILADGETLIHQPFIPAIDGNNPFPDKASAEAAARRVIDKLVKGESPALTREEVTTILTPP